jgi:very-short-patch-repair endonuclease
MRDMTKDEKKVKNLFKRFKKQSLHPVNPFKKTGYIAKQAKKMSKKMTWPEREFVKLMKELKIKFEMQKIVGGKIYDFFIPEKNILVEVDGNYFHGDEKIYEELNPMQKRNKRNDAQKDVLAKAFGYRIERIWESELKKDYQAVKERVKKFLK